MVDLKPKMKPTPIPRDLPWMERCKVAVAQPDFAAKFPDGFTGQDITLWCQLRAGHPEHVPQKNRANAWGGLASMLVRAGVIEPTGERQAMRGKGSRSTSVYRMRIARTPGEQWATDRAADLRLLLRTVDERPGLTAAEKEKAKSFLANLLG